MQAIVDFLVSIITYFEGVYLAALPSIPAGATVYAIAAVLSILSAAGGLIMVVFRRADGLAVNAMIGQAAIIVLAPMLYAAFTVA